MIIENKKRQLKVAVVEIIEVEENVSDEEIEEILNQKYKDRERMWCDANEEIFEFDGIICH